MKSLYLILTLYKIFTKGIYNNNYFEKNEFDTLVRYLILK